MKSFAGSSFGAFTSLVVETPCALSAPATIIGQAIESVRAVVETLGAAMSPASATPFNRPIGPHRRIDWTMMDLAAVKAVKDRLGGTVNDVVLATVAGALRRFLERRRINVDLLDIRANVPVSLRTAEERGTLGNRIALWMTELPVAERDPVRRLAAVRATTTRLKQSKQAMGAEVLAAVSEWTSSTLLALAVQLSTRSRPFNLVVTNVPGPQIPLYLLGAPLRELDRVDEAFLRTQSAESPDLTGSKEDDDEERVEESESAEDDDQPQPR